MKVQKFDVTSLIRLKRNEMPSEDFWDNFDHQLQLKLSQEVVVRKSAWWHWIMRYVYRFSPLTVGCALMVFCASVFVKNSVTPRYVALSNPVSIKECSRSILNSSENGESFLMKIVIPKKMVASNVSNCFSF